MDEPTAALTEADVERLFAIVRLLRARGVGIVYISHRPGGLRARRPGDGAARRALVGTREVADVSRSELITMMVGRDDRQPVPQARGRDRRAGARGAGPRPAGRSSATSSFTLRAARSSAWPAWSAPGAASWRRRSSASAGRCRGDPARRRAGAHREPAPGARLGIAYVPEDRGTQGPGPADADRARTSRSPSCARSRLVHRPRAPRPSARRPRSASSASGPAAPSSGRQALRRQPAEGRARQVAGDQPRVLIMDEPTRGIDVGAKAEIHG